MKKIFPKKSGTKTYDRQNFREIGEEIPFSWEFDSPFPPLLDPIRDRTLE